MGKPEHVFLAGSSGALLLQNAEDKVFIMENACIAGDLPQLKKILDSPSKPDVVYFGNEFCHRLMPGERELKEALELCGEKYIPLCIVIPILPPDGLKTAEKLVDIMDGLSVYPEIVLQDLGILHYINKKYKGKFPLTLGRILSRQRTGPRLSLIEKISPGQFESSKRCHLDMDPLIMFLKEQGIGRLELDWPLQGVDLNMLKKLKENFFLSIHSPWVLVSLTLRCPLRKNGVCLCRELAMHRLKSKDMPAELVNIGNGVFYRNPVSIDEIKKSSFDRIVTGAL